MSPPTRVGWGFDVHRLDGDPPLTLGGVTVSDSVGVSATSDGDVLAHAVSDALLGACVLGDVGTHFPSDQSEHVDADSMVLLERVVAMATGTGWRSSHVDATIVAESVRVSPHRSAIADRLAGVLGLPVDAVSVKATTTDGLGFVGRDEGIAVVAVVTVESLT